jgi:hypothetical protein
LSNSQNYPRNYGNLKLDPEVALFCKRKILNTWIPDLTTNKKGGERRGGGRGVGGAEKEGGEGDDTVDKQVQSTIYKKTICACSTKLYQLQVFKKAEKKNQDCAKTKNGKKKRGGRKGVER